MNKKISNKDFNKWCKKKFTLKNQWLLVFGFILFMSLILIYALGQSEGYKEHARQVEKSFELENLEESFHSKTYQEAKEFWLVSLMILSLRWFPVIIIGLLLGWLFHGVFR